jgi:hypothetical protein
MMKQGYVLNEDGKKRIGQERTFDFYDERPVLEPVDIPKRLPYGFDLFFQFLRIHDLFCISFLATGNW